MFEVNKTIIKRVAVGIAVASGFSAIGGCLGEGIGARSLRQNLKSIGPVVRYSADYGSTGVMDGWVRAAAGQDCLSTSAYNTASASFNLSKTPDGQEELVVHPNGGGPILRLTGLNDPSRFLQPVDKTSDELLEAFGCDPSASRTATRFAPLGWLAT